MCQQAKSDDLASHSTGLSQPLPLTLTVILFYSSSPGPPGKGRSLLPSRPHLVSPYLTQSVLLCPTIHHTWARATGGLSARPSVSTHSHTWARLPHLSPLTSPWGSRICARLLPALSYSGSPQPCCMWGPTAQCPFSESEFLWY